MGERVKTVDREIVAGCHVCHGPDGNWFGANAQALAALHHDRFEHATWVTVIMQVQYGRRAPAPGQLDIETAIAAVAA